MRSASQFTAAALAASSFAATAMGAVIDMPVSIVDGYKMIELDIGTPPQKFKLLFDTGSASAWAVDQYCAENCSHVNNWEGNGYNFTKSSTAEYIGDVADIAYLGGQVAGPTVADVFSLGDVTWNGTFIAANESSWSSLAAHGFMGLGFGSIADAGAAPVFETLMAQKLVDEPRFGLYYARGDGDNTHGVAGNGLLTLGGSREDKYVEGEMQTFQLTTDGTGTYDLWRSIASNVFTSKKACNGTKTESQIDLHYSSIVFDTGASGISLPDDSIHAVYESIGMNWTAILKGEYVPLCKDFTDKWSFSLDVGFIGSSVNLTVTGDQLAVPGFANRDDACWPPFDNSGSNGFALIGTRFLSNFYTVWDYTDFPAENPYYSPKLSFGKLKEGM